MNDLGLVESSEYVLIVAQLKNQGMLQEISRGKELFKEFFSNFMSNSV